MFFRQEENIQSDIVSNYSYDNNADENLGKFYILFDFSFDWIFILFYFPFFMFFSYWRLNFLFDVIC